MSPDVAAVQRDLEQLEALFASLRHLQHTNVKLRDVLSQCAEAKSGRLDFNEDETDIPDTEIYAAR
jgi:hypothetical protein